MLSYLGPELSQIQQSRLRVLGIIGLCAGIAFPRQILSSHPKSIHEGKKNHRFSFNHCDIHMHEAEGADSLAELT